MADFQPEMTLAGARERVCEAVLVLQRCGLHDEASRLEEALDGMWRDHQKRTWNMPGNLPRFADWLHDQWPTFLLIEECLLALNTPGTTRLSMIGAIAAARATGRLRNSKGPPVIVDGVPVPFFAVPGQWAAWLARLIACRRPEVAHLLVFRSAQCMRASAGRMEDMPAHFFYPVCD